MGRQVGSKHDSAPRRVIVGDCYLGSTQAV
jgi:hypothetical protein